MASVIADGKEGGEISPKNVCTHTAVAALQEKCCDDHHVREVKIRGRCDLPDITVSCVISRVSMSERDTLGGVCRGVTVSRYSLLGYGVGNEEKGAEISLVSIRSHIVLASLRG